MKKTIEDKLATAYIISKGRPECKTAAGLVEINYPGPWFIVCGTNDETLPEYIKKWGKDRVLVFDWAEQIKHTDVMDNFGFDSMPSGAAPVRNAVFDFSRARGELRHWQFDDDFPIFYLTTKDCKKNVRINDGELLYWWLKRIAQFGHEARLANVGLELKASQYPSDAKGMGSRIFGSHNMSNDPALCPEWCGRFNDDTLHAIKVNRLGQLKEIKTRMVSAHTPPTQQDSGGLTEMYKTLGTVRKTAYLILLAPNAAKLAIRYKRYHHVVDWDLLVSKVLDPKWQRM